MSYQRHALLLRLRFKMRESRCRLLRDRKWRTQSRRHRQRLIWLCVTRMRTLVTVMISRRFIRPTQRSASKNCWFHFNVSCQIVFFFDLISVFAVLSIRLMIIFFVPFFQIKSWHCITDRELLSKFARKAIINVRIRRLIANHIKCWKSITDGHLGEPWSSVVFVASQTVHAYFTRWMCSTANYYTTRTATSSTISNGRKSRSCEGSKWKWISCRQTQWIQQANDTPSNAFRDALIFDFLNASAFF